MALQLVVMLFECHGQCLTVLLEAKRVVMRSNARQQLVSHKAPQYNADML